MDLPTYVESPTQENYQQELSQTLIAGLSGNGWTIPTISQQNLTTTPFVDPSTGQETTLAEYMPNGTLWYVQDSAPNPVLVFKRNGALRQLNDSTFP